MKVLHFVKTSHGADWALHQMDEMVRAGLEVHVAIPPGGALLPEYHRAGIVVHEMQMGFPNGFGLTRKNIRALVAAVRPDIIHSHFVATTMAVRLSLGKNHRVPRIFSVPGPLHLEHRLPRTLEILTAGRFDYWGGGCQWICDAYVNAGVSRDRVFLAYPGKRFDHLELRQSGRLREELGWGKDLFIVGMVAYMYPPKRYLGHRRGIKGHEDLIDAVAKLLPVIPNLRCIIVGGPWGKAQGYEVQIQAYAQERCGNRIVFLGTRKDVPDLYPDFNVAVHPSHSENLGGAAESLLHGVPTIASNVGGFPDIVRPNTTGFLVPPKAPSALAGAILGVYKDPAGAKEMALAGRALVRKICDVRSTAREMIRHYNRLLSQ